MAGSGPAFFVVDEIEWPEEEPASAPRALVKEAKRLGARRKFLARGEGGYWSQVSEFPAGYTVPMHSHDHHELIVLLEGGCSMLPDGPAMKAGDSMVLVAGYEYGFVAGDDGMTFMTIRTGEASTTVT